MRARRSPKQSRTPPEAGHTEIGRTKRHGLAAALVRFALRLGAASALPLDGGMHRSLRRQYVRRLFRYCAANRGLVALVFISGLAGFSITFVFPWLIGSLIDDVIAPRALDATYADRLHRLVVLTAAAGTAAVVVAVSGWCRGHFTMKLGNRIVTQLRKDLFDHLQRLSLQFFSKQRTGGIVYRLMHEVHGVNGLIHGGIILVALDTANLLITMVLLLRISWKLALVVFTVMPLYVVTFKVFNPYVRRTSERVNRHFGLISGHIQEQLTAIALIKSYATEQRESARFLRDNQEHYRFVVEQSRVGHAVGAVSEMWIHVGTTLIVGVGGYLALASRDGLTAGDITRFIGYTGILYGPLKRFADLNMVYQNSLAAIRRVFRVFDIHPSIADKPGAVTRPPPVGHVRYQAVRAHYEDGSEESTIRLDEDEPPVQPQDGNGRPHWVLNGISFEIPAGKRYAIVGPSGAGKTTLVSLLPRLYDVVEGSISIDGVDVRDFALSALRRSIAIVQQDTFLFSASIRDNLLYARPGASEQEMIEAAQAANAHEFILSTPQGYDTLLGERGINLSGGQRQRVSIARALLKDPRILILDEATSALDTESEALVQVALERLMRGRTCLVIAHRLSTVRSADRILVLKGGVLIEEGRHQELLERNGLYARLVRQQAGALVEPQRAGGAATMTC